MDLNLVFTTLVGSAVIYAFYCYFIDDDDYNNHDSLNSLRTHNIDPFEEYDLRAMAKTDRAQDARDEWIDTIKEDIKIVIAAINDIKDPLSYTNELDEDRLRKIIDYVDVMERFNGHIYNFYPGRKGQPARKFNINKQTQDI